MTVPVQLELLKRRKGSKPFNALPEPSELQIQQAIVSRLRWQCTPGVVWWHCPNGEERDKRIAAKLKSMGVRPGVSDLQFTFPVPAPNLFLELKARGRGLTDDQKKFRDQVRSQGHLYEWTDSVDDAIRILRQHHVLP
jgi:hypothetical protein